MEEMTKDGKMTLWAFKVLVCVYYGQYKYNYSDGASSEQIQDIYLKEQMDSKTEDQIREDFKLFETSRLTQQN